MDAQTIETTKARARDYLRAKGTDAPANSVRDGVREAFASLASFLAGVPVDRVTRRPRDGEWSIQEVADHVLETHRPGLDELRCLLAGHCPPGDAIPASLQSKAPLLRPWPWLLRELGELHDDIVAMLDAAPDDFATDARAPLVMVVNVKDATGEVTPLEWIEELDWKAYAITWRLHAIDHLKQARAALAAAGG